VLDFCMCKISYDPKKKSFTLDMKHFFSPIIRGCTLLTLTLLPIVIIMNNFSYACQTATLRPYGIPLNRLYCSQHFYFYFFIWSDLLKSWKTLIKKSKLYPREVPTSSWASLNKTHWNSGWLSNIEVQFIGFFSHAYRIATNIFFTLFVNIDLPVNSFTLTFKR